MNAPTRHFQICATNASSATRQLQRRLRPRPRPRPQSSKMSAINLATPIRAIPSSLAPRTAPTLPPSSETYEPHVRSVLQQRLLHRIFLPSAGLTWFLSWLSIIQLLDGGNGVGVWGAFKVLFRPSTIFIAAVTWLMGVVPVVVLRKRVMTGEWPVLTS